MSHFYPNLELDTLHESVEQYEIVKGFFENIIMDSEFICTKVSQIDPTQPVIRSDYHPPLYRTHIVGNLHIRCYSFWATIGGILHYVYDCPEKHYLRVYSAHNRKSIERPDSAMFLYHLKSLEHYRMVSANKYKHNVTGLANFTVEELENFAKELKRVR